MAKCSNFERDEKEPIYGRFCANDGWPELVGLCPDHFREHYVVPAQITEFEQGQLVAKLQHRVYLVEVAMGLRASGVQHLVSERRDSDSFKDAKDARNKLRPSITQRNVEDLEEME